MLIKKKIYAILALHKDSRKFAKIAFLLRLISAKFSYINIEKLEIILNWNCVLKLERHWMT